MVRRLAALEDQVAKLQGDESSRLADGRLTVNFDVCPFPDL